MGVTEAQRSSLVAWSAAACGLNNATEPGTSKRISK
jgi:hypothetical protein